MAVEKVSNKRSPLRVATILLISALALFLVVSLITGSPLFRFEEESRAFTDPYAYGSSCMDLFVLDSYNELGQSNINEFYEWMEGAWVTWRENEKAKGTFPFRGAENLDLKGFCSREKAHLRAMGDAKERQQEERAISKEFHRIIKAVILKFSLQRGYEFHNVVRTGERQCFLQSVLIASLLQSMDINAGIIMVFRNEAGEESNNGHAVVLERLSDGMDLLVDASESTPFATHQGLFCRTLQGYRYVLPVYSRDTKSITRYMTPAGEPIADRREIRAMDVQFIQSMFDVYRGEWAEGGLHDRKRNPSTLEGAAGYFQRSVAECPGNPLAQYFLARAYEEIGLSDQAKETYSKALQLYRAYGWVPQGMKDRAARLGL